MSYAIVFRGQPDTDHLAPLAWRLLEDSEEVHAIVSPGLDPDKDYRLRFLAGYERCHIHRMTGVRRTLPWALAFMARRRVRLVAVDWGYGLPEGYERRGGIAVAFLKSLAGSLRRVKEPTQVRTNFVVAARVLGRPAVCLPHGLNIKLDTQPNAELAEKLKDGPVDWRDRNRFAAYVLNTEHHRRWFIEQAMGDPDVMQTWGSMRWDPSWFEVNRAAAPGYEWPEDSTGRVRVVFMLPKWMNKVDPIAVRDLVRALHRDERVSLVIKGHPRPKYGESDPLHDDAEIDWSRVHEAPKADSVSLIAASDCVIDVGSSIGLEVVMQDRVLINASQLHGLRTLFDEIPGSCVRTTSTEEVIDYLHAHADGRRHVVPPAAYDELMRRGVYGSRPEPFDVLALYGSRVRSLARAESALQPHLDLDPVLSERS